MAAEMPLDEDDIAAAAAAAAAPIVTVAGLCAIPAPSGANGVETTARPGSGGKDAVLVPPAPGGGCRKGMEPLYFDGVVDDDVVEAMDAAGVKEED
jgi:hypothetical protein